MSFVALRHFGRYGLTTDFRRSLRRWLQCGQKPFKSLVGCRSLVFVQGVRFFGQEIDKSSDAHCFSQIRVKKLPKPRARC